jgi:hypothetical protein|tara:strand:- start:1040 stop:1276 length:237 start_codon:yes stop_codon:yes gene_type:complete
MTKTQWVAIPYEDLDKSFTQAKYKRYDVDDIMSACKAEMKDLVPRINSASKTDLYQLCKRYEELRMRISWVDPIEDLS